MQHRDADIFASIVSWQRDGHKVALATVLSTWGSAPRAVGAFLAVNENGEFFGSVSGGCVEAAVVTECQQAMEISQPLILEYGVTDDEAFEVGLACGGTIMILVEPFSPADRIPEECLGALRGRKHSVLARDLSKQAAFGEGWRYWLPTESATGIRNHGFLGSDEEVFGSVFVPDLRVFIVGGVHIAQALSGMLKLLDMTPIIVDPRPAWGNADRFPEIDIVSQWPDEAFADLGLDSGTAVVTLTHDSKFDDPALMAALRSDAFYVGALGGRKTNEKRVDRFRSAGLDQASIDRLHSPVGLNIGAKDPAEIAISIAAQIVQSRRQP
jgi:xanthine dehydrogenase accessory factor